MNTMAQLRVYYNSRCPVCDAGIEDQRRRMEAMTDTGEVEWHDINDEPDALRWCGAELDDARRKLYVVDNSGQLHVGVAAFAALWGRTPSQKWLARLVSLPAIIPVARWAYDSFAALLYFWNRRKGRW